MVGINLNTWFCYTIFTDNASSVTPATCDGMYGCGTSQDTDSTSSDDEPDPKRFCSRDQDDNS